MEIIYIAQPDIAFYGNMIATIIDIVAIRE
jgi:hypothetical protein